MPGVLTCQQIVGLALQISKTGSFNSSTGLNTGYTAVAGQLFNNILSGLCQDYDLDVTKVAYNFDFNTAPAPISNLNAQQASGPFMMPPNYLRAKKGDVMWFLEQFPYTLTPVDLEEFDQFVQQAGVQSFPTVWATDVSCPQVLTTTGNTTAGSPSLTGLASTIGIANGFIVLGPGIPFGTVVNGIAGNTVTLGQYQNVLGTYSIVNQNATAAGTGVTITFQQPVLGYVWPPASGAFSALIRYYSQMAPITAPEQSAVIPWFPDSDFLIRELAGQLMMVQGDDRWQAMLSDVEASGSRAILKKYLIQKDDDSNRSKRVTLDRRRFGRGWSTLPASKILGY